MRVVLFAILFFVFSYKSFSQNKLLKRIVEKGYTDFKYIFSDNGNRNLTILFLNDSIIKISNNSNIGENYSYLNFSSEYFYSKDKVGTIILGKIKTGNMTIKDKSRYLKPYENIPFPIDSTAVSYIFPNIEGEVIRFSSDFKKMQVREFCFEKTN